MMAVVLLAASSISYGSSQMVGYYPKGGPDLIDEVSLIQLIANPKAYDGKTVRIIGFLHLEFEGSVIYLHNEDFVHGVSKNGLWIEIPSDMTKEQIDAVNDHYVICTARFIAKMHGHMGMNSGEVANVTRLEVWPSYRGALPPPVTPEARTSMSTRSYVVQAGDPKVVGPEGKEVVAGLPIAFNLYYKQVGPNPVDLGGIVAAAYLRDDSKSVTQEELSRQFTSEVAAKQAGWESSPVPVQHPTMGVSTSQFFTAEARSQTSEPLHYTQDELDGLDKGTKVAFVMLNVPYKDLGEIHQLRMCMWLQTNGVWHYCDVYNKLD
jgi:hypothetical protein